MEEVGFDRADGFLFAEVEGYRSVDAFPSDPAVFICGTSEESVGQGRPGYFVVGGRHGFGEGHFSVCGEVAVGFREVAFAVEGAVVDGGVVAFVDGCETEAAATSLESVEHG